MGRGEIARREALGEEWAAKLIEIVEAAIVVEEKASTNDRSGEHESPLGRYWRTYSGRVPTDVSVRDPAALALLADREPADRLYEYLRGPDFHRVGRVSASKLLAVKRPHLIPIRDALVEKALGAEEADVLWHPMAVAWQQPELGSAVDRLRRVAGSAVPGHVTDARLLDVTGWLSEKREEG